MIFFMPLVAGLKVPVPFVLAMITGHLVVDDCHPFERLSPVMLTQEISPLILNRLTAGTDIKIYR